MLVDSACYGGNKYSIIISDNTPGIVDSHGKCGDYQCNKADVILVAVLRVLVYSGYLSAVTRCGLVRNYKHEDADCCSVAFLGRGEMNRDGVTMIKR